MSPSLSRPPFPIPVRVLVAVGAVMMAAAVALSAYASHGAEGEERIRLWTAATFAFGHGLALAALAPRALRGLTRAALVAALIGALVFAGTLVAAHVFGTSTRLAPMGGSLMIFAWLLYGFDALRR